MLVILACVLALAACSSPLPESVAKPPDSGATNSVPVPPGTEPSERRPMGFPGYPAPTIAGQELQAGKPFSLADLGGKPALVNFFATWCGPCKVEMPEMQALWAQRRGDLHVVAVGSDDTETAEQLMTFARQLGVTFSVVHDGGKAAKAYTLLGVPTSFFVDRKGIVRSRVQGVMDRKMMEEFVAAVARY